MPFIFEGLLFLGKSFDGLTSATTPKFAHYLDVFFHAWILQDKMPRVFRLLQFIPMLKLQEFLDSADGIVEVLFCGLRLCTVLALFSCYPVAVL
jgi:hypothetical protein